ncbi:replication initiation protein RepC, partial [Pseudomonas sp. BGM005]|nr:replication initiation protein RepC [Pseudomonas sp. BG5]
ERHIKREKIDANESQNERHKQNSNPDSTSELEPSFDTKQGARPEQDNGRGVVTPEEGRSEAIRSDNRPGRQAGRPGGRDDAGGLKSFPLGLVLQACPEILAYGPDGVIRNWRDLMTAAVTVRSMLGVS